MATKVIIEIPGERDYIVRIGAGIIANLGQNLREIEPLACCRNAFIITDNKVAALYLTQTKYALECAGFRVSERVLPAGENTKSVEAVLTLWQTMADLMFERDALIIALGGGVIGDLAGFVASTYMRGIPVVHVPTTLLAMVDSSVGGKTAVNLPQCKNLVGTFYQPAFVCADTNLLASLPEREWQCGCAEIVKSAIIDSDDFFFWLSDHACNLAQRDASITAESIKRCVVFKAGIVAQDKMENVGVRVCLNYGHTLGHAIEVVAGFGIFSHGATVAEGMRFAAWLAQALGKASPEFVQALSELLDTLSLPAFERRFPASELLAAMKRDKKVHGGEINFVLAFDVGDWQRVAIPEDMLLDCLQRW